MEELPEADKKVVKKGIIDRLIEYGSPVVLPLAVVGIMLAVKGRSEQIRAVAESMAKVIPLVYSVGLTSEELDRGCFFVSVEDRCPSAHDGVIASNDQKCCPRR